MKTYKIFVLTVLLFVSFEYILPAMTRWNGLIMPVIYENCGAVPEFIQQVTTVDQVPTELGWRRTITCGISGIIFLLVPGFLRFGSWMYKFLRR